MGDANYTCSNEIFDNIYRDNYGRFVRFANSYVKDIAEAEDITTEAFIAYWERRNTLPQGVNVAAYILTSIKNKCLNHLCHYETKLLSLNNMQEHAKWELRLRISMLEACDPSELFSVEIQNIVQKNLSALPKRTAEIFRLSRYENRTYNEIADALNISAKGVEFHITKALALLRRTLKSYLPCVIMIICLLSAGVRGQAVVGLSAADSVARHGAGSLAEAQLEPVAGSTVTALLETVRVKAATVVTKIDRKLVLPTGQQIAGRPTGWSCCAC
jgi:RNA polymerase sigma-70 factor (ECF subfamily)